MIKAVLGLGSNKGDSIKILHEALDELRLLLNDFRAAPFYRTRPMHIENQPDFYNTACAGTSVKTPLELLKKIHQIEERGGRDRKREQRWGPRTLDIDILWIEGIALRLPDANGEIILQIPHPRLAERRFALEPLLELEPKARDPVSGEFYSGVLSRVPEQGIEKINLLCHQKAF